MANHTYNIRIKTGDDPMGGTDSNVFIQLFGTNGQTESIFLPPQDIFAFESGGTDKFVLQAPAIGDLTRCCVGHDNSEGESGWLVEAVTVWDNDSGKQWHFVFNQWLGVEESGQLSACVDL